MNPEEQILTLAEAKILAEDQYIKEMVMWKFWGTNPTLAEVERYRNNLIERRKEEQNEQSEF